MTKEIQITLSPGVRTNYAASNFVAFLLPSSVVGERQKFIRTAIVKFHQAHFKHMRLTLGEMINDLQAHLDMCQSDVITYAIINHVGKVQIMSSNRPEFAGYLRDVAEARRLFRCEQKIDGGWFFSTSEQGE